MRGRAEPEASDSDGSSGCSDATELDPVDRAPRSSAAQLRRYVVRLLLHLQFVWLPPGGEGEGRGSIFV